MPVPAEAQSKNALFALLDIFIIVLIIIGVRVVFAPLFSDVDRRITVSGTGDAVAIPDIGVISFSVVSEGEDPAALQTENTKKVNEAIAFVKGEGVDAKDIKTTQYSLYPKYGYDKPVPLGTESVVFPPFGQSSIVGYTLTQTVTVKVRELDTVSAIAGKLPTLGINQIGQVSFQVDDPDRYLNEAREEAFNEAREKAETMARQNRTRLGRVVTFSESTGGYPVYFEKGYALGAGDASGAAVPSFEPGSEEVSVTVSVTYELK